MFNQVASLLKETFQGKASEKNTETDKYINTINEMFNFRFRLYQGVCPSYNMTLPQKEMLLFGMKISWGVAQRVGQIWGEPALRESQIF